MALAAIELLMSFTFLGYLHIAPISITFAFIPVVIAARFLGTWQAVTIGAVFGLSSMFKASTYYVLPLDRIFSPVGSPSPVASVLLSVGTRMLFGLLMGLIFHVLRGRKYFRLWTDLLCLLAPKFHGLNISADIDHDLAHLLIQFLIAMLAIYFIVALSMLLVYKYLAYKEYLGGLDGLTGIMGRKMFLDHCDLLQKKNVLSGQRGYGIKICCRHIGLRF